MQGVHLYGMLTKMPKGQAVFLCLRKRCCSTGTALLLEQRKEMVSPSNIDSFPEVCISNQSLVPHDTSQCVRQFSQKKPPHWLCVTDLFLNSVITSWEVPQWWHFWMETKGRVLEVLGQNIMFRHGYGTDCVFGCWMLLQKLDLICSVLPPSWQSLVL